MDPDRKPQLRSTLKVLWQHARQSSARIPTKGWIAAGLVLIMGFGFILHASFSKNAILNFRLQQGFHTAQVSLWIDGDLSYTGKVFGAPRKRFGLIPDGSLLGSVSQAIAVSSGRHRIKVRLEPEQGNTQDAVIMGDFDAHTTKTLAANARPSGMSLSWAGESESSGASSDDAASSSGFGHYLSWLLLTIAGSIISALTGYAVKEMPGILRARNGQNVGSTQTGPLAGS